MQKRFCDMCGEPASERQGTEGFRHEHAGKVLCDKKARIITRLHIGFTGHSTGYGGPPDLCRNCTVKIVKEMLAKVMSMAQRSGDRARS